jgi:hypothetical protein
VGSYRTANTLFVVFRERRVSAAEKTTDFRRAMIESRDFVLGSEVPDFRNRKFYSFPEVAPAEGPFLVFSMSSSSAPFLSSGWGQGKVDIQTEG